MQNDEPALLSSMPALGIHRARHGSVRGFCCTAVVLALSACGGGGGGSAAPANSAPPPAPAPSTNPPPSGNLPVDTQSFVIQSERSLDADGDQVGLDTYDLIRDFGGPNPIEAPDLYPINHPEVRHIYEDTDLQVGDHFVFTIHRDVDIDRDRVENDDRQRNEIKTYSSSEDAVKGYENETFLYSWKFKIESGMEVSRRFTHLFQLKAVGGNESQPVVSITGNERSGEDGIEVRHSPLEEFTVLERSDWASVTGEWLEAYCRVTFSNSGDLRIIVTRMSDGMVIFDIDAQDLDLWRGESPTHFVRPKWGIYRSILETNNLRAGEERVRFANFSITEVVPDD